MLTSVDLREILESKDFRHYFNTRVVCGRDELPLIVGRRPAVYIINTLPTYDVRVGHWLCCVFPDSVAGNSVIFFDSLGKRISNYHREIEYFIKSNSFIVKYCVNFRIQSLYSSRCGEYCVYFLMKIISRMNYSLLVDRMINISENRLVEEIRKFLRKQK